MDNFLTFTVITVTDKSKPDTALACVKPLTYHLQTNQQGHITAEIVSMSVQQELQ